MGSNKIVKYLYKLEFMSNCTIRIIIRMEGLDENLQTMQQ